MTEWDLSYGTPVRIFLDDYFDDCGQKVIPYNSYFVNTLMDQGFWAPLIEARIL